MSEKSWFKEPLNISASSVVVLIFGSPNLFSKSTYIVKPEIGDFYLFPNYLMHTVYPFTGTDDERRSVSFNAKVQFYN